MASVIRALPPATTGQPTPCASSDQHQSDARGGRLVSGIIACAAAPARMARAS